MPPRLSSYLRSIKYRLRSFGFGWFTVNMATGIIPILFARFIVGSETTAFKTIALVLWSINLLLFIFFCLLTAARYIIHPDSWNDIVNHPAESLYTAAFPMAMSTLLNGCVTVIHDSWGFGGLRFLNVVWGFWWMHCIVAYVVTFRITHLMITNLEYRIESMSALWMFPVVTLTVASTAGNVISSAIYPFSPSSAWITIVFSMIMILIGLAYALKHITMFFQRLIVSGHPTGLSIMSTFIPLGPLCQSGFSFLLFADNFRTQLPLQIGSSPSDFLRSELAGPVLYIICFCAGFALWSLSTAWIAFSVMAIGHVTRREKIGFGPTYWGLIFPNGVYAGLCILLGNMVEARSFRIWGAIYAVATFVTWIYIVIRVLHRQYLMEKLYYTEGVSLIAEKLPESRMSTGGSTMNGDATVSLSSPPSTLVDMPMPMPMGV